jgi:hypothetical protein
MISRSPAHPFGGRQRPALPVSDERKDSEADDDEDYDPVVTPSRPRQLVFSARATFDQMKPHHNKADRYSGNELHPQG